MATFPGSYIPINALSNTRANYIIDNLLTPRLMSFRQISVFDETGILQSDGLTWRFSYPNWNKAFPEIIRLNGNKVASSHYTVNRILGYITLDNPVQSGDTLHCTYNVDWFSAGILYGFIVQVIETINTSAPGSPTWFDINTAPDYWDGVIADLTVALCMEKLILDYDLWYGRLIFALPNIEESGDVLNAIETLKNNAEERAARTLENEKFKVPNMLSRPTRFYYAAISGVGRYGCHSCGPTGYGRTRGYRSNRISGT